MTTIIPPRKPIQKISPRARDLSDQTDELMNNDIEL